MVWNTIISIITCRSVWSITILARFITQTNSDDTNPPSYFWKHYIYNGDRTPSGQIVDRMRAISPRNASPQHNMFVSIFFIAALVWESYIKLGSHQSQDFDVDSDSAILSFCSMKKYYSSQDWRPLVSVPLLWRHWSWISLQWRAQGGRDDRCCETF